MIVSVKRRTISEIAGHMTHVGTIEQTVQTHQPHYQLTSLSWSFLERNAARLALDLSILCGVRFSEAAIFTFNQY